MRKLFVLALASTALAACQAVVEPGAGTSSSATSAGAIAGTSASSTSSSASSTGSQGATSGTSSSSTGSHGSSSASASSTGSHGTSAASSSTGSHGSTGTSSTSSSSSTTGTSSGGGTSGTTASTDSPTDLDATGDTIPDTNYPIPSGAIFLATNGADSNPGTQAQPVATLTKAIGLVPSGGTIVVRGGQYRDWYNDGAGSYKTASKAFTIQNYPHEQVWFDGTDVIASASFSSDGAGHYVMAWSTPSFCANHYYDFPYNAQPTANTGPCTHYDMYGDPAYPAAGDPQMVFIDGAPLHEVDSLASVSAGNFFYDWSAKKIYLPSNPSGHTVELAARPIALALGGTGYVIRGLGFRRYATNEYSNLTVGAVYAGAGSLVGNGVFTRMAGGGLYLGATGGILRHSVLANNGFNGMGSNGHQHSTGATDGLIIENSLISGNNTEHYGTGCSASCAQSGIKIAHMDGFVVRNNIFQNNINAHGFWCDLACSNGVMIYNLVHHNGKDGLFYEVSDTGVIASNLVHDNAGYGIRVGSANTKVFNNTVVDNTSSGGMWIYDDNRSPGVGGWTDVGPNTTGVSIVNNIVEDLVGTNTIMRVQGTSTTSPNTQPSQFFTAFDYNAYARTSSNQYLVRWIPSSGETDYKSVSTFTAAQGWDAHSTDVATGTDPFFVDAATGDYAVKSGSTAHQASTALPQDVADALGVPASAARDQGAITWPGKP